MSLENYLRTTFQISFLRGHGIRFEFFNFNRFKGFCLLEICVGKYDYDGLEAGYSFAIIVNYQEILRYLLPKRIDQGDFMVRWLGITVDLDLNVDYNWFSKRSDYAMYEENNSNLCYKCGGIGIKYKKTCEKCGGDGVYYE